VFRSDDVTVSNGSFETTSSWRSTTSAAIHDLCGCGMAFEQGTDARNPGIAGTGFGEAALGLRTAFLQGCSVIRQTLSLPGTEVLVSFKPPAIGVSGSRL
jgi:hypothetical protein